MPSLALQTWTGARAAALDDIAGAHRALRGSGPGVRAATQQVNQAYALLLAAHFQGFCRDLHTESIGGLLARVPDPVIRSVMRTSLLLDRKLDRGNAHPGNLGSDFGRLGVTFWPEVIALRPTNAERRALLLSLNEWRNAIAHQDFATAMLRGGRPT